jgi:hypothetical protein
MLSASTPTPAPGASDLITVTVASGATSSTATPSGSVTIAVDGAAQTPLTLSKGSATFTFLSTAIGSHTLSAAYSGDSTYAPSSSSLTLNVVAKSFKLAATSVAVSAGSSGSSTVTVTPQGGYTGTIAWMVSSTPPLTNGCFSLPNTTVTGTSGVTATLTVFTVSSSCPAAAVANASGRLNIAVGPHDFGNKPRPVLTLQAMQVIMAMAGLLLFWFAGRRSCGRAVMLSACILVVMGFAVSGCGGGGGGASSTASPPASTPTAAKGTYTVTVVGTDTVTSSETQTATMSLTVD